MSESDFTSSDPLTSPAPSVPACDAEGARASVAPDACVAPDAFDAPALAEEPEPVEEGAAPAVADFAVEKPMDSQDVPSDGAGVPFSATGESAEVAVPFSASPSDEPDVPVPSAEPDFPVPSVGADLGLDPDQADPEASVREALAALACDTASEVADPEPETLTGESPDFSQDDEEYLPVLPADAPAGDADAGDEAAAEPQRSSSAGDTAEIDHIELAALMGDSSPSKTLPFAPVQDMPAPVPSARLSGSAKGTGSLVWGSRTDVGRVRDHNEDSFVIRFPLFAVADGMGGHAAGEVASTIAVNVLASEAPSTPDPDALGATVEKANHDILEGAANGVGRPGMGTTCTAVIVDGTRMAVAHVGDSRCYLLHNGQLVRVTHDHSFVEELVAIGEITPEEARVHPNRSIITRALGSDPKMVADHFMLDVARGDRIMLCSDGLNSMIDDAAIEEAMVSSPTPQLCADALVDLALAAGGHDNVTCIVVDVKDDGVASRALKARLRNVGVALLGVVAVLLAAWLCLAIYANRCWYLADDGGCISLYQGIPGMPDFLGLSTLQETTSVQTDLLSDTVAEKLTQGMGFSSEEQARATLDDYRAQIEQSQTAKAEGSLKVNGARTTASGEGA